MGIHTKKPHMSSTTTSTWVNSLSFSGYLNSKDREEPSLGSIETQDRKIKVVNHGFEFGGPTCRGSSVSDYIGERSSPYIVRNNSIRRGSKKIREEKEESRWRVVWSFVLPCRECRASKPNVVQPRPIQGPSS
ncbi:hypothetical protein E5676_scaffold861G00970 [Cucumis melo var. makuwa]|uniref:Uncharacterized protein n=2 Tax=Cucumis melo TaxID=3656 RepID=A0A5D3DS79_CUCMM|nr:hypothetical protein E6C27_scaffold96G001880 [Cucumis melo var. makuwa]TYK26433.1 hypothetical protein E5676_scaffold861G00970 [Cucumis melo var. makuwa]